MATVEERCKMVMATVMNVAQSSLTGDVTPMTLMAWDSLSNVQLILALEKEFGISISPEEGIEYITSLANIISFIQKNTN